MISFWMNSSTVPSGYGGVLAQDYNYGVPINGMWRVGSFHNGSGDLSFVYYYNSNYYNNSANYNPNDGNWHFVQIFRNTTNQTPNNSICIYVDNNSKLSTAINSDVSLGVNAGYITVGWESADNAYYIGNIDEVAFWNGAIGVIPTQAEVYSAVGRRMIV